MPGEPEVVVPEVGAETAASLPSVQASPTTHTSKSVND
jgi:hypothetical protein